MKKTILTSFLAAAALALSFGCASVESDPDDTVATRSSTMTSTRETTVAPMTVAPTSSTTTRSTTVQSY